MIGFPGTPAGPPLLKTVCGKEFLLFERNEFALICVIKLENSFLVLKYCELCSIWPQEAAEPALVVSGLEYQGSLCDTKTQDILSVHSVL